MHENTTTPKLINRENMSCLESYIVVLAKDSFRIIDIKSTKVLINPIKPLNPKINCKKNKVTFGIG